MPLRIHKVSTLGLGFAVPGLDVPPQVTHANKVHKRQKFDQAFDKEW